MINDYVASFGLSAEPFTKEVNDSELWLPPSKASQRDEILDAAHSHQHVILTGEPGAGKTCLVRAVRHDLEPQTFRLTYCHNVTISRRDFYRQLCMALGLPKIHLNAGDLFVAVSGCVQDFAREHLFPVFLLDEAHLLHQDTLDHLHILANFDWDSKALLSLLLVGLPELEERLRLRRNRSLYSRIHCRLSITPLEPDDTADYIRVRLHRVGCDREVFSADALAMIHEAAAGSLRDVDRIATGSLRAAYRKKRKLVERDIVTRVCQSEKGRSS
jgi:type II secretory pathway predicted ATPase ExeA